MLVACRLAGLSALEGHYAGVKGRAQCGADTALPAAFIAFGQEEGSGRVGLGRLAAVLRPRRWTRGRRGGSRSRTAAQRVSQAGAMTAPAPCRQRVRYERAGRSFHSATAAGGAKMTHRRGAADGGSESRSDAPVGQAFVDAIPPPVAQGEWLLGLFTALLTITPKSDYLRAVWDDDRL